MTDEKNLCRSAHRWLKSELNGASVFLNPHYEGSECDMLLLTRDFRLIEIEAKCQTSGYIMDLVKKDKKHKLNHTGKRVNEFYYLLPYPVSSFYSFGKIPDNYGIITYTVTRRKSKHGWWRNTYKYTLFRESKQLRKRPLYKNELSRLLSAVTHRQNYLVWLEDVKEAADERWFNAYKENEVLKTKIKNLTKQLTKSKSKKLIRYEGVKTVNSKASLRTRL